MLYHYKIHYLRHTTWLTKTGKIPHGSDIVTFNSKQIQTPRPTQTHFRRVPRHHSPMVLSGIYTTIQMWAKITIASCPLMAVSAHRKSPMSKEAHNSQDVNVSWSVVVMQYSGSGKRTGLRSGGQGGLVFQRWFITSDGPSVASWDISAFRNFGNRTRTQTFTVINY